MIFKIELNNKHYDIDFLERKLVLLLIQEDYERASRVRRWIDELALYYHGLTPEQLNLFIKTS